MGNWNLNDSRAKRQPTLSNASGLTNLLLQATDLGFISLLFVAPLCFGGRHPLGHFLFICLTCVTSLAWFLRQALIGNARWINTSAYSIGLAAILVAAIQLIPLPLKWLNTVAPRLQQLLPGWTNSDTHSIHFGTWRTISLSPSDTQIALVTLIVYLLLFIVVAQRLEKLRDIHQLFKKVAYSAIFIALFGILQYFTSNGHFFWFYDYPYATTIRVAKAGFTCGNHFAHYLVLGSGMLLGCVVWQIQKQGIPASKRRILTSQTALTGGLIVIVLGVLWSGSRGGAMSLAILGSVSLLAYYRLGFISETFLIISGLLGFLVVGLISLHGYDEITGQLETVVSGSMDDLDQNAGRRTIWSANLAAIADGGFFGAGAGFHREIYQAYLDKPIQVDYTHAENGYLQVGSEYGLIGLCILALAILNLIVWSLRSLRCSMNDEHSILTIAVVATLLTNVLHSIIDFVWFIPSCMTITVLLSASLLRLSQISLKNSYSDQQSTPLSPLHWSLATCGVASASAFCIATASGPGLAAIHWDRYQCAAIASRQATQQNLADTNVGAAESDTEALALTRASIYHLRQVLEKDPHASRAHLQIAKQYLKLFDQIGKNSENSMTVEELRDSVFAQDFSDSQELHNWLKLAFRSNYKLLYAAHYHSKRAIQLCPLQGRGYLQLATLSFLEGHKASAVPAYLEQAEKCHPMRSKVLYELGRQYWILGHREKTIEYWQQIYPNPGIHQLNIAKFMTQYLSGASYVQLFAPDWQTLRFVWNQYHRTHRTQDSLEVIRYAKSKIQETESSDQRSVTAKHWLSLSVMQRKTQDIKGGIESLQKAQRLSPNNFEISRQLGGGGESSS